MSDRIGTDPAMELEEAAWEAICRRCGGCCFEKTFDPRGKVLTTSVPCRFLDIHSRQCRVYHQRSAAMEDCIRLTAANLPELDWLPVDCAYRRLGLKTG